MFLGCAFQLIDDVLDYSGDEAATGKHLGDDLAEGKPTLPLIYVMEHGTPEQVAAVKSAIESGGREDFGCVLSAIQSTQALTYTKQKAVEMAERAKNAIVALPDSNYKKALLQLPAFAVERSS
jgi:octaprenyl-diphosphate synthase